MEDLVKLKYETRAKVLKALAHPSRLMIVEHLQQRPLCVYELTDIVGADISTVSKHLLVLKNAGVLYDVKQGTTVYYHLKTPCVLDFIQCVDRVLEINAQQQMKLVHCCTYCHNTK